MSYEMSCIAMVYVQYFIAMIQDFLQILSTDRPSMYVWNVFALIGLGFIRSISKLNIVPRIVLLQNQKKKIYRVILKKTWHYFADLLPQIPNYFLLCVY